MKDQLKNIVVKNYTSDMNLNRIREYLQEYFLLILYKNKFYTDLVFCGGTALRFIHQIKRFSEDLDFSLSQKTKACDFEKIIKSLKEEFIAAGYNIELKYNMETNVYKAILKFSDLLFEYGVSPHKDEKLAIKLEIDINPPAGGIEVVTTLQNNFLFYCLSYDIASLFAGKVHALLSRKYAKGRDWYDLLWYLNKFKDIEPNFVMLNNALRQTQKHFEEVSPANFRDKLREAAAKIDDKTIQNDVRRFLELPQDEEMLTKQTLLAVIG